MAISITKIMVDLNDKKLELTIEEAEELYKTLRNLFDNVVNFYYPITIEPHGGFNITYGTSAPTNGGNWSVYHNKLSK